MRWRIGEKPKHLRQKQIQFYWYCEGRNSVFYCKFAHEFVPMKRSQESSSLNSFWRWKQALVVSSRGTAYLWDEILQVTLKIREFEILSSVYLGRKKYELRMWFWSANLGNREFRMVQKTLEICLSETHASGNREAQTTDLSPLTNVYSSCESSREQSQVWTLVQVHPGQCSQEQSQVWKTSSPDRGATHKLPDKIDEAGIRAENLNWDNNYRSGWRFENEFQNIFQYKYHQWILRNVLYEFWQIVDFELRFIIARKGGKLRLSVLRIFTSSQDSNNGKPLPSRCG